MESNWRFDKLQFDTQIKIASFYLRRRKGQNLKYVEKIILKENIVLPYLVWKIHRTDPMGIYSEISRG